MKFSDSGLPRQQSVASINNQIGELGIEDVTVKDLTIIHEYGATTPLDCAKDWNTMAVYYANNVTLENVKVVNSPATSFAILSDKSTHHLIPNKVLEHPTSNVSLKRCSSVNSRKEAYRFNANSAITTFHSNGSVTAPPYDGKLAGISATMSESSAYESWWQKPGEDPRTLRPSHVEYYPGYGKLPGETFKTVSSTPNNANLSKNALLIDNGFFDYSAEIYASAGALNLSIINSEIWGGIYLHSNSVDNTISNANIIGNYLNGYYAKPNFYLPGLQSHIREGIIRMDNIDAAKVIGNKISGDRYGFINYINERPPVSKIKSANYWLDGANGIIIQNN